MYIRHTRINKRVVAIQSALREKVNYSGLCRDERSSANIIQRTPLSKQGNKHLQTVLIGTAKMVPRNSLAWGCSMTGKSRKATPNRATRAVARKLVAYLVAVGSAPKRLPDSRKRKPHRSVARC